MTVVDKLGKRIMLPVVSIENVKNTQKIFINKRIIVG